MSLSRFRDNGTRAVGQAGHFPSSAGRMEKRHRVKQAGTLDPPTARVLRAFFLIHRWWTDAGRILGISR